MVRRFGLLVVLLSAIVGCERAGEGRKPQIVPPGTARTLDFPGALTTVLLESRATQGDVAVLEFVVRPRSFGAPPHVHHNEDEYFYVFEGEVHFLTEDRVVAAPKGTFAAMTRGHLHAFWNASDVPARLLLAIAPGEVGAFFDQVVAELRSSGAVDPARIGETIARIGREWNVDTHPELVPAEARPFLRQTTP
jgi:mannose-6-phosphate isomerase-like protein (cupin superfamily)